MRHKLNQGQAEGIQAQTNALFQGKVIDWYDVRQNHGKLDLFCLRQFYPELPSIESSLRPQLWESEPTTPAKHRLWMSKTFLAGERFVEKPVPSGKIAIIERTYAGSITVDGERYNFLDGQPLISVMEARTATIFNIVPHLGILACDSPAVELASAAETVSGLLRSAQITAA